MLADLLPLTLAVVDFTAGGLVQLLIVLVVLGIVWYFVQTLPIAEPFKTIIRVVVVLACCLWLLRWAGVV